jgi:arginine:agmatine antiporter
MMRNRKVGPALATAMVANNIVGSGIFLLPASLAAVGSVTIFGWLIATLGALCIAVVLAKLGQVAPEPGGPCAYAEAALGRFAGFQNYVIYALCNVVAVIAISLAAVGYLAHFFPALAVPLNAAMASTVLIWSFTAVNVFGSRFACQVETLALIAGIIPLALVGTVGWLYFDADIFRASWNVSGKPAYQVIPESMLLVFWAFVGLESASVGAAVIENPKRNVPLATVLGLLLVGVLYLATCSVIMGLVPAAALAKSTAPFADAAQRMIGPVAGAVVAISAMIKASGAVCGWIMINAQLCKTGAERGFLPRRLARTDSAGVPILTLLLQGLMMKAIVFATMSPTLNQQFNRLIEVSTIYTLITYIYGSTAIWHFDDGERRGFLLRYQVLAAIAMLFSLWVIMRSSTDLLALTAFTLLATCLAYPLARARDSRSTPHRS